MNKDNDKLLKILYERLDIAMIFEREKKIVIPETTCIIRDIMKIKEIGINSEKKDKGNDSKDFDF